MFSKSTRPTRTAALSGAAALLLLAAACGTADNADVNADADFPEPAAMDANDGHTGSNPYPADNPAPAPRASAPAPAPAPRAAAPAPRPAPAPQPAPSVSLPAGSEVEVAVIYDLASDAAQVGDPVEGRVTRSVMVGNTLVIPASAPAMGEVTQVKSAKRFGGQAMVEVAWQSVTLPSGRRIAVEGTLAAYAKSETGKDTAKIAGGAAAGAILGKVLGGDSKDAAVGAAVGGGIGTAVASKKGQEALLPAESAGNAVTLTQIVVPAD
jgi:hypothetical protein